MSLGKATYHSHMTAMNLNLNPDTKSYLTSIAVLLATTMDIVWAMIRSRVWAFYRFNTAK